MNFRKILASCVGVAAMAQFAGAQTPYNQLVSRILGQAVLQRTSLTAIAPNLAEGREVYNPQSVALDTSVTPNILYVADTGNNRVLAWKNASAIASGSFADMIIGQPDHYSTSAQGPSAGIASAVSYYLNSPVAVAVDSKGNLYIVDAGNNRILRFPKPFSQGSGIHPPDLVIGQTTLNSSVANQALAAPTASSIFLSSGGTTFRSGLAFDSQGNLWFSDAGNNRVLRYPVSALGSSPTNAPKADTVLGQPNFTTNAIPPGSKANLKNFLAQPTCLAFDPSGRLYVADDVERVAVYQNPFTSGQLAVRIMGVVLTPTATVGPDTLGAGNVPPEGIFFVGSNPWVVDTPNSRILGYPPFEQWPAETKSFSPPAVSVLGQPDLVSFLSNQGNHGPSNSTLSVPVGVAFNGTDLYVADSGNQRVLEFPISSGTFTAALHVLGQTDFPYNAPNLIEGREFCFLGCYSSPNGGVAIDASSNPPHLYVADAGNNRILGFKDFRTAAAGETADIVIGQPDFFHSEINYPTNTPSTPSNSGLYLPSAVTVDSSGNLWVADEGNGRVLRFPSPFQQTGSGPRQANLVVGQLDFTTTLTGATPQTMGAPAGIAFTKSGGLLVSDALFNRVLYFRKQGSDFIVGQSASTVIGQADFDSRGANSAAVGAGGLNSPHGIAVDSADTLYVADSANGRIAMFNNISSSANGPGTGLSLGNLNTPEGVTINPATQEIWVANTFGSQLLRYQGYNSILLGTTTPTDQLSSAGPLGLALDGYGNPVVAEGGANRVSFYYPVMYPRNAANYFVRFSPGMLATLFPAAGTKFGPTKASASTLPIPTTLGDVQVLVNGVAAPIFYASPGQINFQVPIKTPTTQEEVTVVRVSTNEVLADSFVTFGVASPSFFTADGSGNNQVSAVNADDNSLNGVNHPVKAGHIISLYGTGQGFINGAPADGEVPSGTISTPSLPQVYAGGQSYVPSSSVLFSGLAPCCVGLWQINLQVPSNAAPGANKVFLTYNGANTANDGTGATGIDSNGVQHTVATTIYVKQ